MQTQHTSVIRGLSIATTVMAALAIVGCLIGFAALGIGGFALGEYGQDAISYSLEIDGGSISVPNPDYEPGVVHNHSLDAQEAMELASFGMIAAGIGIAWELIMCIVALAAGIIGISGAAPKEKMGKVFAWSIVGAVASLLSGRMISMGLFIASAIFANKDKNAPAFAAGAGAPYAQAAQSAQPYAAAPQPYAAPQQSQPYAAPQPQPYATPQQAQPAAPTQPTPYQQVYGNNNAQGPSSSANK